MLKIGSLFSGIGGFDLGCMRALNRYGIEHEIAFQVEQNTFCKKILKKHWPESKLFEDVCQVGRENLPQIDMLMGGFPCQDISVAGKKEGIHGKKSGLWWEMFRIISELRPRIIVLENVSNILSLGGREVLGSLASLGYDAEWRVIRSGADFGAPHIRKRWFCVAYPNSFRSVETPHGRSTQVTGTGEKIQPRRSQESPDSDCSSKQRSRIPGRFHKKIKASDSALYKKRHSHFRAAHPEPVLRRVDDGIPSRLARLKALGNAIVPQAAEYIFEKIILSGLLDKYKTTT